MDLLDIAIKGGLGAFSAILLGLLLLEQKRHDKTRENYAAFLERDREAERLLERERQVIQRERIAADLELMRVWTALEVRLQTSFKR